jgi:hypothetical protein
MSGSLIKVSQSVRDQFRPLLEKMSAVRADLSQIKDVVKVRPGYYYPTLDSPIATLIVAVTPGTAPVHAEDLAKKYGVPFKVENATVEEQIAARSRTGNQPISFQSSSTPTTSSMEALLTGEAAIEFGPPKTGAYEPLDPSKLLPVNEEMQVTICVSPEAGWTELEKFIAGTKQRLTIAMYQFTAPHIFQAITEALEPAPRELKLVLHPVPEKPPRTGVKSHDLPEETDVLKPLHDELGDRFQFSWATLHSRANPDGLWASAYHIKVAVRDGATFWLSSGNFQSSNQPDVHPFADPPTKLPAGFQKKYNRDYHAIITNTKLSTEYETYISRDYELTEGKGKPIPFALPDLIVPVEDESATASSFAAPPRLFPPLEINRSVHVQPLLTPDNYAENAIKLIKSAKSSIRFQNQYINYRSDGYDFQVFQGLISALKDQIDAKLDVRIICRDMMKQESVDVLVALGFPRKIMKFQPACHNKTIIIDEETVMFGSHNWSNEGVNTNRDASLIFYDEEIAKYLAEVYDYDWNTLATAHPTPPRTRVANDGEAAPTGSRRMPYTAVYED